jgi:tetratricopeptide (TPR) repeat protein
MAQQNFDKMLELSPDTETLLQGYHWLLEAWSKSSSSGSSEVAVQILDKMMELAKTNPDSNFPNAQSYSNAILALIKNHGAESAEKAHGLLVKTLSSYENGEFPEDSEPELIAFNGVLSAWARIGRADKAEEVLWMADELQSKCKMLVPDVVSYNSVLHAYVRSKDKTKALDRILAIVKHMEDSAQEQPAIKPDSFTYNTVLKVSSLVVGLS